MRASSSRRGGGKKKEKQVKVLQPKSDALPPTNGTIPKGDHLLQGKERRRGCKIMGLSPSQLKTKRKKKTQLCVAAKDKGL